MTPPAVEGAVRYQDLRSFCRRFDRDESLRMLGMASRNWDGRTTEENGKPRLFLPWDIAGVAATFLQWGTDGGPTPTPTDIRRMCSMFLHLEHPDLGEPGAALPMVLRLIYSQFIFQSPDLKAHWTRAVALFRDTEFREGYHPEVMKPGWDVELLGCSVDQWVSIGFALHAALRLGSQYPFEWTPELEPAFDALGGYEGFDRIVRRGFTTTVADYREARKAHVQRAGGTAAQQFIREPFAYNPLFTTPLIKGIGDYFVAPCFPAVEVRASSLGIVHEGTGRWGEAFRHDTGQLFEQYVGRQLRQIEGAEVLAEREFGPKKNRGLSIDWFVVLPDAVVLIECKGMIPSRNIQEGLGAVEEAYARLAKPIEQINKTARAVASGDPAMADIPSDRPVGALIVTLGNFVLANGPDVRDMLPVAEVPTAFVGIDFLESLVTTDPVELSRYLGGVEAPDDRPGVLPVEDMELVGGPNKLLDDTFETLPLVALTPH